MNRNRGSAVQSRTRALDAIPASVNPRALATGADPEEIEGETRYEGDIENDPDTLGRVNADKISRKNR